MVWRFASPVCLLCPSLPSLPPTPNPSVSFDIKGAEASLLGSTTSRKLPHGDLASLLPWQRLLLPHWHGCWPVALLKITRAPHHSRLAFLIIKIQISSSRTLKHLQVSTACADIFSMSRISCQTTHEILETFALLHSLQITQTMLKLDIPLTPASTDSLQFEHPPIFDHAQALGHRPSLRTRLKGTDKYNRSTSVGWLSTFPCQCKLSRLV